MIKNYIITFNHISQKFYCCLVWSLISLNSSFFQHFYEHIKTVFSVFSCLFPYIKSLLTTKGWKGSFSVSPFYFFKSKIFFEALLPAGSQLFFEWILQDKFKIALYINVKVASHDILLMPLEISTQQFTHLQCIYDLLKFK